jgi:pyridoxal phosphate enzyme (YggS family)
MGIAENIKHVNATLPATARLVAVSKFQPIDRMLEAYMAGQRVFGENKAQELSAKAPLLPSDIEWHFIGHLQSNKVKYIAPFVHMVQSVDSLKLLMEIDREAAKHQRVISCLLQFYIASEESKFGLDMDEAEPLLASPEYASLQHIRIDGVMGMASFTDDKALVRREFTQLAEIFRSLKNRYFPTAPHFCELSMGMSDDYHIALECGSTIVRVGTMVFGGR